MEICAVTSYWKIGSHVAAQRLEIFLSSLAKKTQEDIALYSWPRIADIAEETLVLVPDVGLPYYDQFMAKSMFCLINDQITTKLCPRPY